MSDHIPRKPKPGNLKSWLSQLDQTSVEEDARRFLSGNGAEDQEPVDTVLEETGNRARTDLVERHGPELFSRISARLRGSQPTIKTPVENEPVALEDDQVAKRLIGDATPVAPEVKAFSNFLRRKPRYSQSVSQPAPEIQEESAPIAPQPERQEIPDPDFDLVRATAIEGYNPDALNSSGEPRTGLARLREWFKRLNGFQKLAFLLGTLVVLGLGIYLIVIFSSRLSPSVKPSSNANLNLSGPIPSSVVFPDGQAFALGLGTVTNKTWAPKGAEWLVGTEVPRWLALPWDARLESSFRSYQVYAPINLHMSNGDILVYHFESIQEISREEMNTFHANTTDLLIILSKPGASTRLVIVAGP